LVRKSATPDKILATPMSNYGFVLRSWSSCCKRSLQHIVQSSISVTPPWLTHCSTAWLQALCLSVCRYWHLTLCLL